VLVHDDVDIVDSGDEEGILKRISLGTFEDIRSVLESMRKQTKSRTIDRYEVFLIPFT
jgi:hypothetical protein